MSLGHSGFGMRGMVLKSVRIWGQGLLYFGAWNVGIEPWFWCILGNHSSTEIWPSHW